MSIKIFEWESLTTEQKLDVTRGNTLFCVIFTLSVFLFTVALSMQSILILFISFIVFGSGIGITAFIYRRHKPKKVFADIPQQLADRAEANKNKTFKERAIEIGKKITEAANEQSTPKDTKPMLDSQQILDDEVEE